MATAMIISSGLDHAAWFTILSLAIGIATVYPASRLWMRAVEPTDRGDYMMVMALGLLTGSLAFIMWPFAAVLSPLLATMWFLAGRWSHD